jgi:hypothetical protein
MVKTYKLPEMKPLMASSLPPIVRDAYLARRLRSVGTIEVAIPLDNKLFVVARRDNFDGISGDAFVSQPLYNNPLLKPEEDLNLLQIMFPIRNIDLSITTVDPSIFIGKKVEVIETDSKIIEANFIAVSDNYPTVLQVKNADELKAAELGFDNFKDYLTMLGATEQELEEFYSIPFKDAKNGVVLFDSESYWHKDTSKLKDKEKSFKSNKLIKYLNRTAMKVKDCHKPVRLFGAL